MQSLTIYELRNRAEAHAAATAATAGIDRFCSSLDWVLPAHEAFIPDHPLHLREAESGFVLLARGFNPRIGRYLQPLEASWCLASALVSTDIDATVEEFAEECETRLKDWDLLYLSGIPPESRLCRRIVRAFGTRHRIGLGPKTNRYRAAIDDGVDGYLSRRSAKFRSNLRRSQRTASQEGVTYDFRADVTEDECAEVYERILAVEERSWKGQSGTGILDGGMNTFYRIMLPRLARRGALRVGFLRKDDRDVAFVFGGIFDDTYRGLQLSFDQEVERLSPGNLAQLEMIRALQKEPEVVWYDLGSELDYKSRWAESRLETVTLWVWR